MKDLDTPSDTFESVQQAYAPIAVYARTFGEGQKRKLKVWVISDKAYGETRIEVSGFDSRNIFLDHPGVYEETYEIGNSPRRFHIQAMHGNIQSASFDLGSGFENEEPRPAAKGSR
jgi:hypothetical protein